MQVRFPTRSKSIIVKTPSQLNKIELRVLTTLESGAYSCTFKKNDDGCWDHRETLHFVPSMTSERPKSECCLD